MMLTVLFFFLMIGLAIWDLQSFHPNFKFVFSISIKNAIEILMWLAFGSLTRTSLDISNILTTLILPIHENVASSHLFAISSINTLQFSGYKFLWLSLFLRILFFLLLLQMGLFSQLPFWIVCCLCTETSLYKVSVQNTVCLCTKPY